MSTLSKIVDVLEEPKCIEALIRWRPASVASFHLVNQLRIDGFQFKTIIDGGANVGQFARAAAEFFPEALVHSIEPVREVASVLRRNLSDCPRVKIYETALGSYDGSISFYRNSNSQMSSALRLEDQRPVEATAGTAGHEIDAVPIPITRLDTLLAHTPLERRALLKLDLQGFELEALRGATATLAECDTLIVETVFQSVYKQEPLFSDVADYLKNHRFCFKRPLAFLQDRDRRIFQMDALFERG